MAGNLAFGIHAGNFPGMERLGLRVEQLGYEQLWANDSGGYSGLTTLAACAPSTRRLQLGVGAIPLLKSPPSEILRQLDETDLPLERLIVGIGSGRKRAGSLDRVREGVRALRADRPEVRIATAAAGPAMCRLGGEIADYVLLTWSLPQRAAWARDRVAEGAAAANRPMPRVALYVRTALGPGSEARLRREMARYVTISSDFERIFAEQGNRLVGIALDSTDPQTLAGHLLPYRDIVDTCVVRGMPATDDLDAWLQIAEAAAPHEPMAGSPVRPPGT